MVSAIDRAQLERVVANRNTPQKLVNRARAMLWQADRQRPSDIAARLGVSRNQVHRWTQRYLAAGVAGLLTDAPRPGGRKKISLEKVAAVVEATLTTRPPAATHWSTRLMANSAGHQ